MAGRRIYLYLYLIVFVISLHNLYYTIHLLSDQRLISPYMPVTLSTISGKEQEKTRVGQEKYISGSKVWETNISSNSSFRDHMEQKEPKPQKTMDVFKNGLFLGKADSNVPSWQKTLAKYGTLGSRINGTIKYFLTEVVRVRIYDTDQAKWTIAELKQWIHYLFLAGVEHIYLCDHYKSDGEILAPGLKLYTDLRLVTYIPWPSPHIKSDSAVQVACYQHVIDKYKLNSTWQMAIDMDEYPYSQSDKKEGFIQRYLGFTMKYQADVSEVSMSNYLMLGQGDRKRNLTIDRINRQTFYPTNSLVKPIYQPVCIDKAGMHHNYLSRGRISEARHHELRMFHYWGSRTQNWGPDTNETLSKTREMNAMRETWAGKLRYSLLSFGEYDSFSNSTGP